MLISFMVTKFGCLSYPYTHPTHTSLRKHIIYMPFSQQITMIKVNKYINIPVVIDILHVLILNVLYLHRALNTYM